MRSEAYSTCFLIATLTNTHIHTYPTSPLCPFSEPCNPPSISLTRTQPNKPMYHAVQTGKSHREPPDLITACSISLHLNCSRRTQSHSFPLADIPVPNTETHVNQFILSAVQLNQGVDCQNAILLPSISASFRKC